MSKNKSLTRTVAVIVAAGSSRRMGINTNKQFLMIDDTPVLALTLMNFANAASIDSIVIVTKQEDILTVSDLVRDYGISKVKAIVPGGATRQDSVVCGLNQIENEALVAVHDGARPFASSQLIDNTVAAAIQYGAAAPGVVPKDTVKVAKNNSMIDYTPSRDTLRLIQTPQVFRCDELKLAYIRAAESGLQVTDDCSVMEHMGVNIYITDGEYTNIKVTTPDDLPVARAIREYFKK